MNQSLALNPAFSISDTFSFNWKLFLKLFWISTFILLISLLSFLVFQINQETRFNYLLATYEKELMEISEANKNLEVSSSQYIGLGNIESLARSLNFEKPDKIHYIKALADTVVSK